MLQAFLIGLINLKKVSLGLRRNLQGKDKVLEDRDRFATDLLENPFLTATMKI
ncbi:MAG: hypothetical protein ACP5H0_06965 [Caldisericum sp.]|uniref:hypothetical protein n=1 Tax=Caldisericum sp. TaxID=2499687 RepID=UPI003D1352DE